MSGDMNVKPQENRTKLHSDIHVNGDRRSYGGNDEIEMDGQMNRTHRDSIGSVTKNGKDRNEISQNNPNEMDSNGKAVNEGDKKHEFFVGKFVWGKIKNNPWWPGQIYDPSDASDYAKKLQKSEKLLVAFFGDSSFSWCSVSQLKPFVENFEKMSKQNTSRKLTHAVEASLNEISRIVECKMSRYRRALARPLTVNAGIRLGVLVPEFDPSEMPKIEPAEIISLLRNIARNPFFPCMPELMVLKGWLSAFHRANGENKLAMSCEPHAIEGLVDVSSPVLDTSDEDSVSPQHEFDESYRLWLRKCEGIEVDKLYKKRKRRSVAKLMKADKVVEPENEIVNMQSVCEVNYMTRNKVFPIHNKKKENEVASLSTKMGDVEDQLVSEKKEKETKENHQVSQTEKDGRDKLVSTYEKRAQNEVASLNSKNSDGENKDSVTEKLDKATIGETENVDTGTVKRVSRSLNKDISIEKDDRYGDGSTYGKKKQNEIESIERCENKVPSAKNGEGEGQLASEMKDKESVTEKVDKKIDEITKIGTENVATSGEKRTTRSSIKGTKGKSGDKATNHGGEHLSSPLQKMTRKRKNIIVTHVENDEREQSESIPAKDKELGAENVDKITKRGIENVAVSKDKESNTEKVEKITERGTENVAASGEKRKTRSLVQGTKGTIGDEAPNHRGEKQSFQLQMTTSKKKKKTEKLDCPEIKEKKESDEMETDNPEETESVLEFRERKKSMYLSPPFINFTPKTARMGERLTRVAGQVIGSIPNLNSNNKPLQNNLSKEVDSSTNVHPPSKEGKGIIDEGVTRVADQNVKEVEKMIIDWFQINVSMRKVVSAIRSAAPNPLVLWDKNFLQTVEEFIFAYRNVKYLCGSYYKIYHNAQPGKKCSFVKTRSNLLKPNDDEGIDVEASKPVSLLVIFPPGFCLPSKTELIAIFSQLGTINEMETDVSHECYCGKIVFLSDSDTEKAFNTCLEESPFGSAKVSYRLRYSAGSKKGNEIVKKHDKLWASTEFEGSCLLFLKQKLEIMTSMVDNCRGNMSNGLMMKLENEMKGLLDNLSSVTSRVQLKGCDFCLELLGSFLSHLLH